ncbi:MAG: glycosyltransferase family 4 protein [Sterolibacterium sp.]|jgi:alpha-1,3-rhamnosyl/mannosyltransferase|nr:glycosyltransferase family 4 protein [Sterolibacterium sp.]
MTRTIRVALNARILQAARTGIGQYVAGLADALLAREDIELSIELSLLMGRRMSISVPPPRQPAPQNRLSALLRPLPGAYRLRRLLEQAAFDKHLRHKAFDLYHEPSLWPYDFDGPMVMTLHDLTHLHYPHTQPPARLREIERHIDRSVTQAARILVDSAYIGREVARHFALSAEKIIVAPLGCSTEFHPRSAPQIQATLSKLGLQPREYLLCVGTLEPRKNLPLALRAHARLPEALRQRYPLLLVGMAGWNTHQFSAELHTALAAGHVRLTGYLESGTLAELVAGARALVYPSLYEGFGLPVVEAMASGTPVIVSNRASLPEVAGNAGRVVDAEDEMGLCHALQILIEDEAAWQAQRLAGLQQATQFTWPRCAEITAQAYHAAMH